MTQGAKADESGAAYSILYNVREGTYE